MTNRLKLVVAYDGTDFRGWAAQTGHRTVQGTLKEAVRLVSGEDLEIVGASRTDSGAHAKGQVCHFDSGTPISPENWKKALNRVLPLDLAVVRASKVDESFHSRFCAMDRHYVYSILIGERDPFAERFAFRYWQPIDVSLMKEAAKGLLGEHDFRAFTEELHPSINNTRRKLNKVNVREVGNQIKIEIAGTAFLRGMMRRMAGGLYEVGRGVRSLEDFALLLTDKGPTMHLPVVLPARGLTLKRIRYGRHPRDNRRTAFEDLESASDAED